MIKRFVLGLGLTFAAIACSSSTTSTPGTPNTPSEETPSEDAGLSDPGSSVEPYTEAEVQDLFDQRCLRCHGPTNTLLDLSTPFTRETVGVKTGSKGGACGGSSFGTRIVPGDREASLLWQKVKGTQDCGDRMPYEKGDKRLDASELERLGLWIDGLPTSE